MIPGSVPFRPGQTWSRWDMLKFNAADFVQAIEVMATIRTMTRSEAEKEKPAWADDAFVKSATVPKELKQLREVVVAMNARLTVKAIDRLLDAIQTSRVKYGELPERITAIHMTLRDELDDGQAVVIVPDRVKYWRSKEPLFGPEVRDRFGAAIDDVEEAGNCLATENGTATVFHLMRVMEAGLKGLAKEIGIDYAPSWESYIKQITTQLDLPHPKKPRKVKRNLRFYKEVLGDLHAVKYAWRNPTMHIERKYSPDEAEEIFKVVCRFMQRLAAGLSPLKARPVKDAHYRVNVFS